MIFIYGILAALLLLVSGTIGVWLFHHFYFVVFPERAIKKYSDTDPERLRRYLERVVATPSLLGSGSKLVARGGLIPVYSIRGDHAQAVTHCRAQLACLTKLPDPQALHSLEGDIRRRLADCLEALGQVAEANEERALATAAIERAPADTLSLITQGIQLHETKRHQEAYAAFQQALNSIGESNIPVRIECLIHMVLSAYDSGRPSDCLRCAKEAITLGVAGKQLYIAYKMAGIASGNLSRLDDAEDYTRRAYEAATADNRMSEASEVLGLLADYLRRRGKLAEARETGIKIAALKPKSERILFSLQSLILKEEGRYDDALAALVRAQEAGPFAIPSFERRSQAVIALSASRIEVERGRGDEAWQHIQKALNEFKDDAKLGLNCDAVLTWVLAVRGLSDESQHLAVQVNPRLAAFEGDPSTCRSVLYDLGMAACVRGDHAAGIECWNRYCTLNPDPVYQPTAYYYRGECHREIGQLSEAEANYRAAVNMNLETHHSKLAKNRLRELATL